MTKYDDASWHYEGDFPEDLPESAGATHIGMFVTWCLLNQLFDEEAVAEMLEETERLERKEITPGAFLMEVLDGKFVSDDLTDTGNAFAFAYYEGQDDDSRYIDDYSETFDDAVTDIYRVPDSWDAYEKLAPHIAQRYESWVRDGHPLFID